jgi:hypothetical protein
VIQYLFQSWLIKPFSYNGALSQEEQRYNYVISSTRNADKKAYGRLTARWHHLMKRNNMDIDNSPTIVAAGCV